MAKFNRHITRKYNANKTNRIRYDKDDFRCEILSYDKTFEQSYIPQNVVKDSNGKLGWFHGMKCLKNRQYDTGDKSTSHSLNINFSYEAKETSSNYRIELLFANLHRTTKKAKYNANLRAEVHFKVSLAHTKDYVDLRDDMAVIGTDVNYSRVYQYCKFNKGLNMIKVTLSPNTIFLGMIIKKYDIWEASRSNYDNDKLTMISATVEHTDELKINTMTAEFIYYPLLDEKLLPTDPNANRSGLVFDYRDEINLYIKDTDNIEKQVFGGYISTCKVDDELTKVTVECADRLIDLDRRYCLSEVTINSSGVSSNTEYKGFYDYKKDYSNYSSPIKFLMNNNEVYLNTNISVGNPLVKNKTWKLAKYRKKGYNKFTKKNMNVHLNDSSITVRNGADTLKSQSLVIYDSSKTKQTVELNKYPNLFLHYGLGVEKWAYKYTDYSYTTVENGTNIKASKTWIQRANSITKATGERAIKAIFNYVQKQVKYEYREDFYQSAEKTWSRKRGNCCCQAELFLTLLNAKGIGNLQYVHRKRADGGGHVYTKVNGFVCDPTTIKGWGDYCKGYGNIRKTTNYPTKPF